MKQKEPSILKFMSVDGKVFHMRCRSVFDALLDGSLLGFLALCITLFTIINVLTSAVHGGEEKTLNTALDALAIVMFIGMTMFGVLILVMVLGSVFSRLAKWGLMKTIYIPLFYVLPILVHRLGVWFLAGEEVISETFPLTVMFLITCACFDILYGNFVAPYHSKYIGLDDLAALSKNSIESPEKPLAAIEKPASQNASPNPQTPKSKPHTLVVEPVTAKTKEQPNLATSDARPKIYIRKKGFFIDAIRWIQSEDHYLNVHLSSESILLLGKLADAVSQLPIEKGVQINRSMWVAHNEIQSIEVLTSRKVFVTLTSGEKLKVTKIGRELLEKTSADRLKK